MSTAFAGLGAATWTDESIANDDADLEAFIEEGESTPMPFMEVEDPDVESVEDLDVRLYEAGDAGGEVLIGADGFEEDADNPDVYALPEGEFMIHHDDAEMLGVNDDGVAEVEAVVYDGGERVVADGATLAFEFEGYVDAGPSIMIGNETAPDAGVADTFEAFEQSTGFLGLGDDVDAFSASAWTEIGDEDDSVTLDLEGQAADSMDDVAEDADAEDRLDVGLEVNGDDVYVFADEAPEDFNEHTHGVYDTETGELVVELGDEHEDAGTAYIDIESHDGPGFWSVMSDFGVSEALSSLF